MCILGLIIASKFPNFQNPLDIITNLLYFCNNIRGALVAQSVECWTCNWKVEGSNPGMEGPFGTIFCFICHPCLSEET